MGVNLTRWNLLCCHCKTLHQLVYQLDCILANIWNSSRHIKWAQDNVINHFGMPGCFTVAITSRIHFFPVWWCFWYLPLKEICLIFANKVPSIRIGSTDCPFLRLFCRMRNRSLLSEREFTRLVDRSVFVCVSADQCTTWPDEEKNVIEWFGKCET